MFREEFLRRTEPFREQLPQPPSADFRARTIVAEDWSFGMFRLRLFDGRGNFQPVAHRRNLAERNPRLHHAERAGIHAQKNHALPSVAKPPQKFLVRFPGVSERIINVRDRRGELQPTDRFGKFPCGGDELPAGVGCFQGAATIF